MNERVVLDRNIRKGKPVIRGTRVPVVRLVIEMAGGASAVEAANAYGVTVEDVYAALQYAADLVEPDQEIPALVEGELETVYALSD